MSASDVPSILQMMMTDFSDFYIIPDRTIQGIVNKLYLMRLVMTGLSHDNSTMNNGTELIDPTDRVYYGRSQGGILGGLYMAATTDVELGVLGVGGNAYAILLPRSVDFTKYFVIVKARYLDPLDRIILIGNICGQLWDRGEASGYMHRITTNPLPGTPPHRLLLQYSLHDSQVHYLGQYVFARSVGAYMFQSNVYEDYDTFFGFPLITDDSEVHHSMLQGWDFQRPPVPRENIPPPEELDTHSMTRSRPEAQEQIDHFFNTGTIRNFCEGPCVY